MKIIPASYEILDRRALNVFQKIEQAGRLAYKSEDKINDESAELFVHKLTDAGHYPVIEFANIHVLIEIDWSKVTEKMIDMEIEKLIAFTFPCKYVHLSALRNSIVLSGTVRGFMNNVIQEAPIEKGTLLHLILSAIERGYKDRFPYKIDAGEVSTMDGYTCSIVDAETVKQRLRPDQIERHLMCAVKFIHNRAFTHELVRHRIASYIQESQRYVNYSLGKHGNEVTFIAPTAFFKDIVDIQDVADLQYSIWHGQMDLAETAYLELLKLGASPQAARTVLPNSCKTEIIIFTTIEEWRHIFSLRTSAAAEPSMREVMCPLAEEFFSEENQKLWE